MQDYVGVMDQVGIENMRDGRKNENASHLKF